MLDSLNFFLSEFKRDPWNALDNLDLNFAGFQINLLRNDEKLRKALFEIFFLIPLIAWVLFGADSTVDQIAYMLINTPNFILQKITFQQFLAIFSNYYGLGTHWSASVIYSGMFIGLSLHLRKNLNIKNSLNLALTGGFVALAIGTFELFWQVSYAVFQNQWWILRFQFPQSRILTQDVEFFALGFCALLVVWSRGFRFNVDKRTIALALATLGLILLWWYYPFPTQQLAVQIEGYGTWISSLHFPQTMYTIPLNINDAIGTLYHIEDSGVHLLNNLAKISMTLFFYSLFKIKKATK